MKKVMIMLSAAALCATVVCAENFGAMSTDQLLEKRGTLTNQQERMQLHNELMNRQQTMTKEQQQKFMNKPENATPKMKNQGQGQGMMQGQQQGQTGQGKMQGKQKGQGMMQNKKEKMMEDADKVSSELGNQDKGKGYGMDQDMMKGKEGR